MNLIKKLWIITYALIIVGLILMIFKTYYIYAERTYLSGHYLDRNFHEIVNRVWIAKGSLDINNKLYTEIDILSKVLQFVIFVVYVLVSYKTIDYNKSNISGFSNDIIYFCGMVLLLLFLI